MTGTPEGIKSAPPGPWDPCLFGLAALLSAIYLLACAHGWDRALALSSSFYEIHGAPPALAQISPRHFLDTDALFWLTDARDLSESGSWRIRWTRWDNAPAGRASHWSQPMIWMLGGAGKLRAVFTGEPLPEAIESAASAVQPVLLTLFLILSSWAIRSRWGLVPSLFWLALIPASKTLFWAFHPFRPDHQALQILAAFGTLFFLTLGGLGWVRPASNSATVSDSPEFHAFRAPSRKAARLLFAAAGLCSGIGLWLGATVSLFCTGAMGAAWIIWHGAFLRPLTALDLGSFQPGLWRIWGGVAGASAFSFYLLEYFPGSLPMRLEVNHPLYALAWVGAGEILASFGENWVLDRRLSLPRLIGLGLALAALSALVLALWMGPDSWHALRHVGMRRLHLFISEFQSTPLFSLDFLRRWIEEARFGLLFLPISGVLLLSRNIPRCERSAIGTALFTAAAFLLLASWQNRWSAFAALFLLWTAIPTLPVLARLARDSSRLRRAFAAFLLLLAAQSAYSAFDHLAYLRKLREGTAIQPLLTGAIQRDFVAQALARDPAHTSWRVVASDPSLTPALAYGARIPGLASFYWENIDGLEAATEFFTDSGDLARARQLARERGLTHLLVSGPDKMAHDYDFILHGFYNEPAITRSLGGHLRDRPDAPPSWILPTPEFEWLPSVSFTFRGLSLPTDALRLYSLRPE